MTKSKGNMYDWITHTANPLSGECSDKCSDRYVNKLKHAKPTIANKYTGKPQISENGLKQISGKGKFIFICDMTDLFAENVAFTDINTIIDKCESKPENKYLLQTKNTKRFLELSWLIDHNIFSLCTTFESNRFYPKIMGNVPKPIDRIHWFRTLGLILFDKYITIEPIMDFDLEIMVKEIKKIGTVKQVNIGADSGRNNLPEPSKEKILQLISELEKFTKVKQKSNLKRLLI